MLTYLLPVIAALAATPPKVPAPDPELEKQAIACGISPYPQWRGWRPPDAQIKQGILMLRVWQGNKKARDCMQKWGEARGLMVVHWQD